MLVADGVPQTVLTPSIFLPCADQREHDELQEDEADDGDDVPHCSISVVA